MMNTASPSGSSRGQDSKHKHANSTSWLDPELLPKDKMYAKLPPLTLHASLALLSQAASGGQDFTDTGDKAGGAQRKDIITPRTYRATIKRYHQVHLPEFPTGLGRNAPPWLMEFGGVTKDTFAKNLAGLRPTAPDTPSSSGSKTDRPGLRRRGSLARLQKRLVRERDERDKKLMEDSLSGPTQNKSAWWVMESKEDQAQLKKILKIPPSRRSKGNISQLLRALTTLDLFSGADRDMVENICRFTTLHTAKKGELLYQTGDKTFHYIIISGYVNVIETVSESSSGEKNISREGTGYHFGGITTDLKDMFVVAKSTCDLVKIGMDDYKEIQVKAEVDYADSTIATIGHVVIFRSWPREKVEALLPTFHHHKLKSNQVIQRQGNQAEEVWFIKKGQCKCVREVSIADCEQGGRKTKKLLEIAVLGANDFFGDEAIVFKTTHPYSVFATCPSEAYSMSKHDFIRKVLCDKDIEEIIRSFREAHTASDRLTKTLFQQSEAWQTFREGLRIQLEVEKQERKQKEWGGIH